MSEKEKDIVEKIAAMPKALQDKFLDQLQGAALAMDALAAQGGEPGEPVKEAQDGG